MQDIFTRQEIEQIETMHEHLQRAEEDMERAQRHQFEVWGAKLGQIKTNGWYSAFLPGCTWEQYTTERWEITPQRAGQLIAAHDMFLKLKETLVSKSETTSFILPSRETHIRPLAMLDDPNDRAEVWQRIVANTSGHGITGRLVKAEVERKIAELNKAYITLEEWLDLAAEDRHRALTRKGDKIFNDQTKNENIEWAAWSWNPITGCKHGCQYCYARDIANRFYPHKFEPTFHPDRLTAPQNTRMGQPRWDGDIGYKGVFVCSMADLFGNWVPQEWIDAVLASVRQAPQWTFIFLTKNPSRLVDCQFPANAWVGTTVDRQARVKAAEDAFGQVDAAQLFVSCEPMLERLTFSRLDLFDWVIVGGQSRSSQQPESQPEWEWVEHLLTQARQAQCAIYFKDNLKVRPREYPM